MYERNRIKAVSSRNQSIHGRRVKRRLIECQSQNSRHFSASWLHTDSAESISASDGNEQSQLKMTQSHFRPNIKMSNHIALNTSQLKFTTHQNQYQSVKHFEHGNRAIPVLPSRLKSSEKNRGRRRSPRAGVNK